MEKFILIKQTRILRSTIKRYQPVGECNLALYFSASRNKLDKEVFKFNDEKERNDMLTILDALL